MFCTQCGSEAHAQDRFCRSCGRPLTAPPPAATEPRPMPVYGLPPIPPSLADHSPAAFGPAATPATLVRPQGHMLVTPAGTYEIAGFGIRLGGFLIDVGVYFVVGVLIGMVFAAFAVDAASEETSNAMTSVSALVSFAMAWTFNAIGWSLGKRAVGLRIVKDSGGPPGPGVGLGRTIGSWLSALALGLGYLWAAWDDRHQTWHDKMAGTYVVRV